MSPAPVSVGRVRVQDVRRDPLATRVSLDRLLSTAALRPHGLPPSAILVVRTLRDPLPHRLRLDRAGIRPPPEWEHAVAASLDDLARGAARPAREAVGANAAAVLFADRAELLACLLADWAAGVVASRWWWRLVVRGSPEAAVPAELRASPTYVPAAFAALAERGVAVAVAASLPPEEALAIARSVAATFGVRVPHVEAAPAAEQHPAVTAPGAPSERVPEHRAAASSAASPVAARLLPSVPEARARGLRAEQRTLLAVALGLRRAPGALRPPAEPAPEPATQAPPIPASRRPEAADTPRPGAGSTRSPARVPHTVPPPPHEGEPASPAGEGMSSSEPPPTGEAGSAPAASAVEPAPVLPGPPTRAARPAERPTAGEPPIEAVRPPSRKPETPPPPEASIEPTPQPRASAPAREAERAPAADVAPAAPPVAHEPDTDWSRLFGPAVETRLGGLFFLVNVAIDLGLYGDFTQPDRPGSELDVWDFLTLTGRRLLSVPGDDPVWRLLAELAGRDPEDPPGAGFAPPDGETLADWTAARAREIRAVLDEADLSPTRLLRRPAVVHVTEAHIDVVFALTGHPLEIRIAGLDRDPGFVPAAGRHVAFHFE